MVDEPYQQSLHWTSINETHFPNLEDGCGLVKEKENVIADEAVP